MQQKLNDGHVHFEDSQGRELFSLDLVGTYYLFREWHAAIVDEKCAGLEPGSAEHGAAYEASRLEYLKRIKRHIDTELPPEQHYGCPPINLSQADSVDESVREQYYAKKNSHNQRIVGTLRSPTTTE